MTLQISVRDYRGVERADISLDPLALVAGRNEQGKSCLAEAARAALAGVPIPVPGINKKDAKLLVRDGANGGTVSAAVDNKGCAIEWPKCDIGTTEGGPGCSDFAVGLLHLFDLDPKERSNVLADYLHTRPTVLDLAAAMDDLGYSEEAAKKTWAAIEFDGWDGTWKKAREHTARLKGQWEMVTGEKYGPAKAGKWMPAEHPGEDANQEALQAELDRAHAQVKEAVGKAAVSEVEVDKLRQRADEIPELERQEKEAAEAYDGACDALAQIEDHGPPPVPMRPMRCPECGTPLMYDGTDEDKLLRSEEDPSEEEIAKARRLLEAYYANLEEKKRAQKRAGDTLDQIVSRRNSAKMAKAELAKVEGKGTVDTDQVAKAEAAESSAKRALAAFNAKENADKLHAQIQKNDALAAVLAPDGLRRRKLSAGLERLNQQLVVACNVAGWPIVRVDENLNAHYGTRPLWSASKSGQYRARIAVQVVMAQMDGSAAVVIDEADMLDARGRNGLVELLKEATGLHALVCLTANKPERVPDLAKTGIGRSFWISSGVAVDLAEACEHAA